MPKGMTKEYERSRETLASHLYEASWMENRSHRNVLPHV